MYSTFVEFHDEALCAGIAANLYSGPNTTYIRRVLNISSQLHARKRFDGGNCDSMLVLMKVLQVFGCFGGFDLLFEEKMPLMETRTLLAVEAKLQEKVRAVQWSGIGI
jgi:hypothetical protein